MKVSTFHEVTNKFLNKGLLKGGELLLPTEVAIDYVVQVSNLDVRVAGMTFWKYADQNKTSIVEVYEKSYYVADEIYNGENAAKESANAILAYLRSLPHDEIDFITVYIFKEDNIA